MKRKSILVYTSRLASRSFLLILILPCAVSFSAESSNSKDAKKISTQQVGGLLFDVDEGVKIEQGGGGSVYLKSNKDYMQEKFSLIDKRISELEERVKKIEMDKDGSDLDPKAPTKSDDASHKVLVG